MALLTRGRALGVTLALLAGCASEGEPAALETSTSATQESTTTSSTTSTTVSDDPCVATVQALDAGPELDPSVDLVDLANREALAPLPVPGADEALVAEQSILSSPEEFVQYGTFDDPQQRVRDLEAAGFRTSIDQAFVFGDDHYGIRINELASPEQAATYRTAHLVDVCPRALGMHAMTSVPGGASFYRADVRPPLARATFVVGRFEVNLDICRCVEVSDRLALAEAWAARIIEEAR